MNKGLVIVGAWATVLLLLSIQFAVGGSFGTGYPYFFTIPFILMTILVIALSLIGLTKPNLKTVMFWSALVINGSLLLPCNYAMKEWPRSDDGCGCGWAVLVTGGAFLSLILSIMIAAIVGIAVLTKKRKNEPGDTPNTHSPSAQGVGGR